MNVYGPLTGFVDAQAIWTQLKLINDAIERGRTRETFNEVVMVYYHGQEVIRPNGHFFLLSRSDLDYLEDTALNCDKLPEYLANACGAKVLLLDVVASRDAEARDRLSQPTEGPHVGVLCSRWTEAKSAAARRGPTLQRLADGDGHRVPLPGRRRQDATSLPARTPATVEVSARGAEGPGLPGRLAPDHALKPFAAQRTSLTFAQAACETSTWGAC